MPGLSRTPPLLTLACLASLATGVAPLAAQVSLEVGPFVAYYRPLGHFEPSNWVTSMPVKASELAGTAWGAEMRLGLGRHWAVQADGAVTSSSVGGYATPGGDIPRRRASVTMITAQAAYDLLARPGPARVWISAGPGLVRHGGDAYAFYDRVTTSVAAVLGTGVDAQLTTGLHLVSTANVMFYGFRVPGFDPGSGDVESGDQRDLLLRIGLDWSPLH